MNYYNRHIGDYLKDTSHLTLLEHGIYTRLMDVYYVRESALPQDQIARLIGARTTDEISALNCVLSEFFELVSGSWIQHRCEKEIEAYSDKSIKAKRSASARWEAKTENTERNTDALPTHNERNTDGVRHAGVPVTSNQEPITNNQKPKRNIAPSVASPDGVSESVWSDFCQHRKSKGAKLTQTAIDGIQAEAGKAGWALEAALRECCARGWTGFKADWVADKPRNNGPSGETAYQRSMREKMEQIAPSIAAKNPNVVRVIDVNPTTYFENLAKKQLENHHA